MAHICQLCEVCNCSATALDREGGRPDQLLFTYDHFVVLFIFAWAESQEDGLFFLKTNQISFNFIANINS